MKLSTILGRLIACLITIGVLDAQAIAAPTMEVVYNGVDPAGNNSWTVFVAPDADLFDPQRDPLGGSLATELAFAVRGSTILEVDPVNTDDWEFDIPGNNPFTGGVTFGVVQSGGAPGATTEIFASLGGRVFFSGDPVELISFRTFGSEITTVDYGTAASGDPQFGNAIAQAGAIFPQEFQATPLSTLMAPPTLAFASTAGLTEPEIMRDGDSFRGYSGSVSSIPEPASAVIALVGLALVGRRRR